MLTLVAEKQSRTRSALRLLIEQAAGFPIVAEVADTESLTTTVQKTLPDLVLLDWELSQGKKRRINIFAEGVSSSSESSGIEYTTRMA